MTFTQGANLLELRTTLGLRPMAEFDPHKPARLYDANGSGFDWDPRMAGHYLRWAAPYKTRTPRRSPTMTASSCWAGSRLKNNQRISLPHLGAGDSERR